jgi:hypothetical protein
MAELSAPIAGGFDFMAAKSTAPIRRKIDVLSTEQRAKYAFAIVSFWKDKITWPKFQGHYQRYRPFAERRNAGMKTITYDDIRDIWRNHEDGTEVVNDIQYQMVTILQHLQYLQVNGHDSWGLGYRLKRLADDKLFPLAKDSKAQYAESMHVVYDDTFFTDEEVLANMKRGVFYKKPELIRSLKLIWEKEDYYQLPVMADMLEEDLEYPADFFSDVAAHFRTRVHTSCCKYLKYLLGKEI